MRADKKICPECKGTGSAGDFYLMRKSKTVSMGGIVVGPSCVHSNLKCERCDGTGKVDKK